MYIYYRGCCVVTFVEKHMQHIVGEFSCLVGLDFRIYVWVFIPAFRI